MNPLKKHPNAIVGGLLAGGGAGQLIVELLSRYGHVTISGPAGAGIAAGAATVALAGGTAVKYVWNHGVRGTWRHLLDGRAGAATAGHSPSAAAPGARTVPERLDAIEGLLRVLARHALPEAPVQHEQAAQRPATL